MLGFVAPVWLKTYSNTSVDVETYCSELISCRHCHTALLRRFRLKSLAHNFSANPQRHAQIIWIMNHTVVYWAAQQKNSLPDIKFILIQSLHFINTLPVVSFGCVPTFTVDFQKNVERSGHPFWYYVHRSWSEYTDRGYRRNGHDIVGLVTDFVIIAEPSPADSGKQWHQFREQNGWHAAQDDKAS